MKLSLRARLTAVTVIIITLIAILLTVSSIYQFGFFSGDISNIFSSGAASSVTDTQVAENYAAGEASSANITQVIDTYAVREAEVDSSDLAEKYGRETQSNDSYTTGVYDGETQSDTGYATESASDAMQSINSDSAYDSEAIVTETAYEAPSAEAIQEAARTFSQSSLLIMVLIIMAGGVTAYFVIGQALRPVRRLSDEIASISENALDTRVSCPTVKDEIGRLAASFNTMLFRLEKAFESQKNFSSAAAHELKTPLTAIKANIDVLEMDGSPSKDEYARTVNVVKGQSERMIKLVDDLFTMTVLGENAFTDEIYPAALIENIVHELQPDINERSLEVSVKNFYSKRLFCNEPMLRRLFTNIILNAVKYNTDGGRIDVTILENERSCMITVADTGVGIPEEHLANIFDPFYRVDKSRSRRLGGSGLGLAIAKDMAEKHGGSIQVWPNVNGGSVFTVQLPKDSIDHE